MEMKDITQGRLAAMGGHFSYVLTCVGYVRAHGRTRGYKCWTQSMSIHSDYNRWPGVKGRGSKRASCEARGFDSHLGHDFSLDLACHLRGRATRATLCPA